MGDVAILWCVIWISCAAVSCKNKDASVLFIPSIGMLYWWIFK